MSEIETKKVNLELEIDTNVVDSSKNRWQNIIDFAKVKKEGIDYMGVGKRVN